MPLPIRVRLFALRTQPPREQQVRERGDGNDDQQRPEANGHVEDRDRSTDRGQLSGHSNPAQPQQPGFVNGESGVECQGSRAKDWPGNYCGSRSRKTSGGSGKSRSLATPATHKCDTYLLANAKRINSDE